MKRLRNLKCETPCLACKGSAEFHHIKSFKSGGPTIPANLMPLCRKHHSEVHSVGMERFAKKNVEAYLFLRANGWFYSAFQKKWVNPTLWDKID